MPASSAASTTRRARFSSSSNVFQVPSPTTGPRRRSSIRRASHVRPLPRRTRSGRRQDPLRAPAHVAQRQTRAGLLPAIGRDLVGPGDDDLGEAQVEDRLRVMRDATMAFARIGLGGADGQHRPASECRRNIGGVREPEGAVPESRARSDDPGADATHDRVVALPQGQGECRSRCDAVDIAVQARCDGDRSTEQPAFLEDANRVRKGDRKRTSAHLDVGHPSAGERCADRSDLAVQRARARPAVASSDSGSSPSSSPRLRATCPGVYGSAITCAPSSAAEPETARQVRVEDVEPAGPELEQSRLLVDEHLVARPRPHRSAAGRRRTRSHPLRA